MWAGLFLLVGQILEEFVKLRHVHFALKVYLWPIFGFNDMAESPVSYKYDER